MAELTNLPSSPFHSKTIDEVQADEWYQFDVLAWLRSGRRSHMS